jgi:transcriptional regulator with XRE-family HTH domain
VRGFGALLQAYVGEAGYSSLNAFARDVGTSGTTISECIRGLRPPPLADLERWAKALGLRGETKSDFIRAGWRMKAISREEAVPYIEYVEEALRVAKTATREGESEINRLTRRVLQLEAALRDAGVPVPADEA